MYSTASISSSCISFKYFVRPFILSLRSSSNVDSYLAYPTSERFTNLAELVGEPIENCIEKAYNEIKNRKGKMINGTFKKN